MTKSHRTRIITHGSGGVVLVIDVSESVSHTFNSNVAEHAIEGKGYSVSDHMSHKNAIIQVNGYISDAWPTEQIVEKFDTVDQLDEHYENVLLEHAGLTQMYWDTPEGDTVERARINLLLTDLDHWLNRRRLLTIRDGGQLKHAINAFGPDGLASNNRIHQQVNNGNYGDQWDAYKHLQGIRNNYLLCDVSTMLDYYPDMVLKGINHTKQSGRGRSLFLNLTFEQQRLTSTKYSASSIRKGSEKNSESVSQGKRKGREQSEMPERMKQVWQAGGASRVFVDQKY